MQNVKNGKPTKHSVHMSAVSIYSHNHYEIFDSYERKLWEAMFIIPLAYLLQRQEHIHQEITLQSDFH